jgi:NifB/MoaA-like Fe-S oxidoreductase
MIIGYRNQFPPIVKITGPPIPVPHTHEEFEQCDEKIKRCEEEVYK